MKLILLLFALFFCINCVDSSNNQQQHIINKANITNQEDKIKLDSIISKSEKWKEFEKVKTLKNGNVYSEFKVFYVVEQIEGVKYLIVVVRDENGIGITLTPLKK